MGLASVLVCGLFQRGDASPQKKGALIPLGQCCILSQEVF